MRVRSRTKRRPTGPLKADEVHRIVTEIFSALKSIDDDELKKALSTPAQEGGQRPQPAPNVQ